MLPQLDRGQLYIHILSICYVLISVLWVNMRRILSCFPVHPCYVPQFQKMSFHGIFQFVCTCGSAGKESACNARNLGLIPGLGRSPREGKGYPLQVSSLENSMDSPCGCKELDRLSDFHFHLHTFCSHTCLWVFISFYFNHLWAIWGIGQFCIVFFFALYPFLSAPTERSNFQFQGLFMVHIFCLIQDIAQCLAFSY